ncbi:hypothetical protein STCU_11214 [Strigomonas culicis]|uniref:Uncharacterized protein n=1 Tax=Strigomonas culicis TaxID=28005 RepID=S9TEK7_9TRYP|nr:hypothetical protein STCU_11214 [Strigomonas culicis]|eukprot:EPY16482.1 hypothetical protein STCU_11214 [Strigomonas culicis]
MFHVKALLNEACRHDLAQLRAAPPAAFADAVLPFFHAPAAVPAAAGEADDDAYDEEADGPLSPTTCAHRRSYAQERQQLVLAHARLQRPGLPRASAAVLEELKAVHVRAARLEWRKVARDVDQCVMLLARSLQGSAPHTVRALVREKAAVLLSAVSSMALFQPQHLRHAGGGDGLIREVFAMREAAAQTARRLDRREQLLCDLRAAGQLFAAPPAAEAPEELCSILSADATPVTSCNDAAEAAAAPFELPPSSLLNFQSSFELAHYAALDGAATAVLSESNSLASLEAEDEEGANYRDVPARACGSILCATLSAENSPVKTYNEPNAFDHGYGASPLMKSLPPHAAPRPFYVNWA